MRIIMMMIIWYQIMTQCLVSENSLETAATNGFRGFFKRQLDHRRESMNSLNWWGKQRDSAVEILERVISKIKIGDHQGESLLSINNLLSKKLPRLSKRHTLHMLKRSIIMSMIKARTRVKDLRVNWIKQINHK